MSDNKKLDIKNIDFKKITNTLMENKRYVFAGVLLIFFIVVLCVFGGKAVNKNNASGDAVASGNAGSILANNNEEIKSLIANYYDAYANGDIEAILNYALPVSENELSYISLYSEYVDHYSINNIYTKQGVDENSFLVSVDMSIKFNGADKEAPGLDFFYVTKMADGSFYIDNLYSQFNLQTKEYLTEDQITDCIKKYESRDEIIAVQTDIQAAYEEAILNDENLDDLINKDLSNAISDWMASITLIQNQNAPENILVAGDENDDNEDVITEDSSIKVVEEAVTTSKCNMREKASTSADTIMTLKEGAKVVILNMNTWGDWSHVKVNGKKGYVRNDLLKTIATEYTVSGTGDYPSEGDKVELKETTNLLRKMKDDAGVVSSLVAGTKVKIVMIYQNGYAKVTNNGKTGYVKTSTLDY